MLVTPVTLKLPKTSTSPVPFASRRLFPPLLSTIKVPPVPPLLLSVILRSPSELIGMSKFAPLPSIRLLPVPKPKYILLA